MCLICDRIALIREGKNPYFVRETETGYVVIGDKQYFPGYTLFLCKQHKTELCRLDADFRRKFLEEMTDTAQAVSMAFGAEKMNYEPLGNGDSHLHWHLYPRRRGDLTENGIDYGVNGAGPVWWMPWKIMNNEKYRVSGSDLENMKAKLNCALDSVMREKGK